MQSHIDKVGGDLETVNKPTGFASSSWAIMRELDRLCKDGSHVHVPLMRGRAVGSQVYPGKLCEAICGGLARHKDYDGRGLVCTVGLSKSQTADRMLAMMSEIDQIRSEDSTAAPLCATRIGSSGYSSTIVEDDRPRPHDKEEEDAHGGRHMSKPKAVNGNSWLETNIDKPELMRPNEFGPSIEETRYMKKMGEPTSSERTRRIARVYCGVCWPSCRSKTAPFQRLMMCRERNWTQTS